jgi:LysM repeat protein
MKQRDRIETVEADFEVDFSDQEGYSARRKNKGNRSTGKPPGKIGFSLMIGAVILGLFVLVAVLFQRSSYVDSESKMRSLETRIKQLEERLYRLGWIEANLEQVEKKSKQFNSFRDTFKKTETSPKIGTAQTAKNQTKAVYHEVVAGETLYSISRHHSLTVEELRRLNQLKSGEIIHPKQMLLVRPADTQ